MRLVYLVPVFLLASSLSGCSICIARCGKDVSKLTTRDEVQQDYGQPINAGEEDGILFEDFRTNRKVAEAERAARMGMGWAMTFGLIEFCAMPVEIYNALKATIVGQTLRFYYDASGRVVGCKLNGETLLVPDRRYDPPVENKP